MERLSPGWGVCGTQSLNPGLQLHTLIVPEQTGMLVKKESSKRHTPFKRIKSKDKGRIPVFSWTGTLLWTIPSSTH